MSSVRNRNKNSGGGRNRNSDNKQNSRSNNNRRKKNSNDDMDDDDNTIPIGRRVYCKSGDSAVTLSKQISMAALPDSIQGFPVRVFARRADAVNVAVKATAIATARLANLKQDDDEPIDLVCIPYFRENRNEVSLHVVNLDTIKKSAIFTTQISNFNIGAKTDIKTSAGAIAGSARNEEAVVLQSIGKIAVFNAIRSVAVAREYLDGRGDDVDLFVKVEFTEVKLEGRDDDTTAVKLTCFLHKGPIDIDVDGDNA